MAPKVREPILDAIPSILILFVGLGVSLICGWFTLKHSFGPLWLRLIVATIAVLIPDTLLRVYANMSQPADMPLERVLLPTHYGAASLVAWMVFLGLRYSKRNSNQT